MQGVEREPSLGPEQLPPDQRIPNDQLLRGASAVEVIGAVRSWLQANFPPPRSVRVQIAESEEDIARIEHKWRRLAERKGLPRSQGDIDRNVRAARLFNEVVLLPQVLTEFSGSIWQRARAARTLAHEWWRISRLAEGSFPPFEEGSADVFADLALRRMTGFDASKVGFRQYPKQAQAVEAVVSRFMCKSLCTGEVPLPQHLLQCLFGLRKSPALPLLPLPFLPFALQVQQLVNSPFAGKLVIP